MMIVNRENFERLAAAELVTLRGGVEFYNIGTVRDRNEKLMAVAVSSLPPTQGDLVLDVPEGREDDYPTGLIITQTPWTDQAIAFSYGDPVPYVVRDRFGLSILAFLRLGIPLPAGIIVSPAEREEESVVRWLTLSKLADVTSIA